MLDLQRSVGNRVVTQLLRIGQTHLEVGAADDPSETEADAVARDVVAALARSRVRPGPAGAAERMAGPLRSVQRQPDPPGSRALDGGVLDAGVESAIRTARGSGRPLPAIARTELESAFGGVDFSSVRLHAGPGSVQLNRALSAEAFTVGSDIFFSKGIPDTASPAGQGLLAHELTHAIQQGATGAARSSRAQKMAVQRLARPSQLRATAGQEHRDIKALGVRLRKMSVPYKAVLAKLATYHDALATMRVFSGLNDRQAQAKLLKRMLDDITASCEAYVAGRNEGPRRDPIATLGVEARREKAVIDAIASAATGTGRQLEGPPWGHLVEKVVTGYKMVEASMESEEIDSSVFHGTGSPLLGKLQGELLSGAELARRGGKRSTGEGDLYSDAAGEKEKISVGLGAPGLGTALSYATASSEFKEYNPARYSDAELDQDIRQLDTIIANWRSDVLPKKQDKHLGLKKSKSQFEVMRARLLEERTLRKKLRSDHPRHRGEKFEESTYPLMFEFSASNLNLTNPRGQTNALMMDTDSPRPMGGERGAPASIDLRDPGRLRSVWCPVEKMGEVRGKVAAIVGHDGFKVIPIEAVALLPEPGRYNYQLPPKEMRRIMSTAGTLEMTLTAVRDLYHDLRRSLLAGYAKAMTEGVPISDKLMDEVLH